VSCERERARESWDRVFKEVAPDVRNAPPGRDLSDIVGRLRAASAVDVLDVGCGLGRWSVTLARAGFRVLAADVSSEAVRIVRERAQREGLAIGTAVCAAQELSRLGVHVDAVLCNSVLDHMHPSDAERAAASIEQVLKPAGLVYVSFDGPAESGAGTEASPDHVVHSGHLGVCGRFTAGHDLAVLRGFGGTTAVLGVRGGGIHRRGLRAAPGVVPEALSGPESR